MKIILFFLILLGNTTKIFSDTRTNDLPSGFHWRYISDEKEPSPRSGQFWRDGLITSDKIIVLNSYILTALDFEGKELWKYPLPLERSQAHAKIHLTETNEIIVVTTERLIRLNIDTGELLKEFVFNTRFRSAFQFTELLPRQSLFYNDYIYVFLSSDLLKFDKTELGREKVFSFNAHPKTLPIIYKEQFLMGFQNGFLELFNPETLKHEYLICGSPKADFSIRQPIIAKNFIFVPTNDELYVYEDTEMFTRNDKHPQAIISYIGDKVWMREHESGLLQEIDETLSIVEEVRIASPRQVRKVTSPLFGTESKLVHLNGEDGELILLNTTPKLQIAKRIYTEEFSEIPPLQILFQKGDLLLMGGFHGLYFINISEL